MWKQLYRGEGQQHKQKNAIWMKEIKEKIRQRKTEECKENKNKNKIKYVRNFRDYIKKGQSKVERKLKGIV